MSRVAEQSGLRVVPDAEPLRTEPSPVPGHGEKILFTLGVCAALLRFVDPASADFFPPCPFHFLTGLHCPGCGSLRALHQLLNGNLTAAFALNPLAIILLPFILYHFVCRAVAIFAGKNLSIVSVPPGVLRAIPFLIVAYWALRNIPCAPFNFLAP